MIPDGYYNVVELDEEAFRLLGAKLRLPPPTGRLQLRPGNVQANNNEIVIAGSGAATAAKKRLVSNSGLAKLLRFSLETFEPGKTYTADEPHKLAIHREICVHLAEVSTSENLHNGRPSTLLKSIPVENERCGVGGCRTETFPVLQYKRLASGPLSQLTLMILDTSGRNLGFDYLSAVLHIRRNG